MILVGQCVKQERRVDPVQQLGGTVGGQNIFKRKINYSLCIRKISDCLLNVKQYPRNWGINGMFIELVQYRVELG